VRGIHESKSEPGLEKFSEMTASAMATTTEPVPKLKKSGITRQKITINTNITRQSSLRTPVSSTPSTSKNELLKNEMSKKGQATAATIAPLTPISPGQ
jgi:hypothetical protein